MSLIKILDEVDAKLNSLKSVKDEVIYKKIHKLNGKDKNHIKTMAEDMRNFINYKPQI